MVFKERIAMLKKMDHKEYPKRLRDVSISALRFTITDALAAMRALPDNPNNSYYADEVCYCSNELNRRKAGPRNLNDVAEAVAAWD